jgi:hypothetical protein
MFYFLIREMKMGKPIHFSLIIISTLALLWRLLFGWWPHQLEGDSAFQALVWTTYTAELIRIVTYYLAFCTVVLGHAICSIKYVKSNKEE